MIRLEHVSYTYTKGGPFEKKALDDISLHIREGEFIGVIGHTGSGKSTLIQLLNGLLKPDSGEVIIDGKRLGDKATKMRDVRFTVGLVMQYPEYQLFEESIAKDIAFGPRNMGLTEEEIQRRVAFAAEVVGLKSDLLEKSPFDLSGGQKRRAAIAGVLAMQPKVLILDEPISGVDQRGMDLFYRLVADLRKRHHIGILLVSHDFSVVEKYATRVVLLDKTVLAQGSAQDVFGSTAFREVFGGSFVREVE